MILKTEGVSAILILIISIDQGGALMKSIALIFAGGTGTRLSSASVPKQFLVISSKPVIIHTLEYFQINERIDSICVVCLKEKIDCLNDLIARYGISKVNIVVPGGASGQESIFNGLKAIYESESRPDETVVLIHDGVRPLINQATIDECIRTAEAYGNAITVSGAIETIMTTDDKKNIADVIDRKTVKLVRAPQCFLLKDIFDAHLMAHRDNYTEAIDSATLMHHYGHTLHTVEGPSENIKITTASDYYMARAIMEARENSQVGAL